VAPTGRHETSANFQYEGSDTKVQSACPETLFSAVKRPAASRLRSATSSFAAPLDERLRALRQAYALVPSRSGLTLRLGHARHNTTPSAANAATAIIAVGG
jgi:hypothetical protein